MSTESYISVLRSVCVCFQGEGKEGRHTLKATLVAAALLAARRDLRWILKQQCAALASAQSAL